MPNARTPARLAFAAALIAAFVLAATPPRPASACPVELPTPLRPLYLESELVVVARVGDSLLVSKEDEDGAGLYRTALHVSKFLKGESKERAVDLYRHVWDGDTESEDDFKKGGTLLLFLERREEGDGYSLTDYRFGVKKLTEERLKVYVRRIEELVAIVGGAKPDPAEITEWLVRCAEEPATRWEGAYELALNIAVPSPSGEEIAEANGGARAADDEETRVVAGADASGGEASKVASGPAGKEAAATPADDKPSGDQSVEVVLLPPGGRVPPETDFAALLTQSQKERLKASLFNAEELGEGELTLLPLVAGWGGDARLAPFALKHLQRMADKPTSDAETLTVLAARALGDKGLIKLAAEYCAAAAYDDLNFSEDDGTVEAGGEGESKEEAAERRAAAAEALNLRSTKLYHFLALAGQPQKP